MAQPALQGRVQLPWPAPFQGASELREAGFLRVLPWTDMLARFQRLLLGEWARIKSVQSPRSGEQEFAADFDYRLRPAWSGWLAFFSGGLSLHRSSWPEFKAPFAAADRGARERSSRKMPGHVRFETSTTPHSPLAEPVSNPTPPGQVARGRPSVAYVRVARDSSRVDNSKVTPELKGASCSKPRQIKGDGPLLAGPPDNRVRHCATSGSRPICPPPRHNPTPIRWAKILKQTAELSA